MNTPLDNPTENFECKCDDAYHVCRHFLWDENCRPVPIGVCKGGTNNFLS